MISAKRLAWCGAAMALFLVACGSDDDGSDGGMAATDGGMDSAVATDAGDDETDAAATDAGGSVDSGGSRVDAGHADARVLPDGMICPPCAPPPSPDCVGTGICGCGPYVCPDAGAMCGGGLGGSCGRGLECSCCPAGGPRQNCLCSTPCKTDADCTTRSRPTCQRSSLAGADDEGFCAPSDFVCCWLCR